MVGDLQKLGHSVIARRTGGEPVELVRSPEEVVFLGFDPRIKRLVELHVMRSGNSLGSVTRREAFDRAREATSVRGSAFMRVLDVGEDNGLVYYTTNLNDGELIRAYVTRRGPFPQATGLCLVLQLLDDLIQLQEHRWLVAHMRLDRVVVSTHEDAFLQLRVYDYGLSASTPLHDNGEGRLVVRACELIFLMLTGREFDGDNPDRYPALSGLPMNLRITLRTALTDLNQAPISLEQLRDDVREAYSALVSSIQARNPRKQLVVTPALQPRSQLQDLLLENTPIDSILGNRFRVEDSEQVRRYPFSIPCINVKNDQPVTVHLLPPSRIVDKSQYDAVPLQTWRFDSERHPNILRSLSLWESPEWTFLSEEREPGFTVSRLMAERVFLNAGEVLLLMRQVQAGMEQALECGVERVDLHPSNIVLRVGKAGPLLNREYERLMQKRLDAWPHFQVKLRAHLTMRNLYEPLLVEPPQGGEQLESHLADRDYRHRSFVMLAAYLLTGERFIGGGLRFSESLPDSLVNLMRGVLELTHSPGQTPSPSEFLEKFEMAAAGPTVPNLADRLRGSSIALEDMESAGSVSDFEEEWSPDLDEMERDMAGPVARTIRVTQLHQRPRSRLGVVGPVWAAAAAVAVTMGSWWYFSALSAPAPADHFVMGAPDSPPAASPALKAKPLAAVPTEKSGEIRRVMATTKPEMVKKADEPANVRASQPVPPVFANIRRPVPADMARASSQPAMLSQPEEKAAGSSHEEGEPPVIGARSGQLVMARIPRPSESNELPAVGVMSVKSTAAEVLSGKPGVPPLAEIGVPASFEGQLSMAPIRFDSLKPLPGLEAQEGADSGVPVMQQLVKTENTAPAPQVAPPAKSPEEAPVVVRRALVPSAEELNKLRQIEDSGVRKAEKVKTEISSAKGQLSRR